MKKIRVIQIIGIILFVIYIGLLVVDLILDVMGDYLIIALSVILAIIALNLISKGVIIKSSSTLWFAITLIIFAITIIIFELNNISSIEYLYIFSLIPIIASLLNLAIFKNLIYIKVIIFNISIIIPIFINEFVTNNVWNIIAITFASMSLGIFISRSINFGNNKEKENG